MPKTYIQKSRKIFNGKKGQANSNPGAFTRVAENENKKSSGNGTLIVVFAFVLFLFDIIIDYRGFNIVGLGQISGLFQFFKSLIFIVGIAAFFYFLTSRDKSPRAIASFIIAALIIIITLIFLFNLDPAPIYHFIFILVFWATFVRQREDAATANLILVAVLFFDLYFNSIINIFAPQVATWLEGIPFLFFLTLGYVYEQTNNKLAITFIGLILLWYLFTSGQAFASGLRAAAVEVVATELPNSPQEWLDMTLERLFTKPYDKVSKGVNAWISGQIQYAITGKVEKNQYEPLGVYLENVKSADAKYYENEDVVIWGTVRARTLDDPVNVKIGCYAKDGTQKIETKNVDPKATFPVFKLEEQDFACTFKNSDFKSILKSGSNTITTFADFNFETLAFLKVYFMDRERLRAMTRENLDPFQEFGIKDKKPVTIFTNGPAAIGMETTSPLIGVGESYITFPTLSMSIQNNQGWQGRIKKFEEVILLLPKGVGIASPETDCGERKFTRYYGDMCKTISCTKVNTECINVCDNGYTSDFDKNNCKASCDDKLKACQNDCNFLFEEEGQQYEGFELIKEDLEKINTKLAKDDQATGNFEFFRCKLSPRPNEVLENTPITTKSIRLKTRYQYTVEKPVSVRIDKLTTDERTTKIGEVAITGVTKTETRIIELANQRNFAIPSLAVSVANWETRGSFNHCKDSTLNCGTSNSGNVNCNPSGSCGVMQINKNAHPDLFTPGAQRLNSFGCSAEETAYDLDCNIKSGIGLLEQNYNTWGSDTSKYNSAVDNYCKDTVLNAKYKSYVNPWDRALRAYNGFGCTTGADVNYVEEVNKIKETKYSGK